MALAARLDRAGLTLVATTGTAAALAAAGLPVRAVKKLSEGSPNVVDLIAEGGIDLVVNTPRGGPGARTDGYEIRAAAVRAGIPCITTIEAGRGRRGGRRLADGVGAPARCRTRGVRRAVRAEPSGRAAATV